MSPLQRWASGEGAPALLEGGGLCLWRHRDGDGRVWVEIRSAEPRVWVSVALLLQVNRGEGIPWLRLEQYEPQTWIRARLIITGGRHGDQRVIYRLEKVLDDPWAYLAVWPD